MTLTKEGVSKKFTEYVVDKDGNLKEVVWANYQSFLMSSKNPALWKPTLKRIGMNYKGFTLHSVVPRPGSMVTLEKPSLIGGNYIQSIYAKKPQPIVLKKKKW